LGHWPSVGAPFTGLKSSAAFPVTRKTNKDITSIAIKLSASLQRKLNQQDDDYLREQSQRDLQIPFQRGSMLC
jgi:hypothetical protein